MKTTNQFRRGIHVGKRILATTLVITGISAISSVAHAQAVNLGAAADFSTLSLDVATNTYTQQAVTDAMSAGTLIDSMSMSSSFASAHGFTLDSTTYSSGILTNTTIGGSAGLSSKSYIFDVSTIQLTGTTLDINAPSGAKVVLDVSGAFMVMGGKILVSGGIDPKNLLIDLSGTTGGVGVVSNGTVQGTILAPKRDVVVVSGSTILGKVIAQTVSVSSDSVISPDY